MTSGVHHALTRGALHVHDRRFASDRDRFLEGADAHLGVDGRRERAGQIDAIPLDGVEAGQRERDGVGAGPQLGDPVLPEPSVTAVRTFSMIAGLAASTVTPGSTAPDVSFTTPVIDA